MGFGILFGRLSGATNDRFSDKTLDVFGVHHHLPKLASIPFRLVKSFLDILKAGDFDGARVAKRIHRCTCAENSRPQPPRIGQRTFLASCRWALVISESLHL